MMPKGLGNLLSASLLSAVGSLPLHLMPLIVHVVATGLGISAAKAGWIAFFLLGGQLLTSLLLPLANIHSIGVRTAFFSAVLLLLGLAVSLYNAELVLYIGWFLTGLSCGLFQYLGIYVASNYCRQAFAFTLRLAIVLLLAGVVAAILEIGKALESYGSTVLFLSLSFSIALIVGLSFYKPVESFTTHSPRDSGAAPNGPRYSGLLVVFVLFAGQTGFLAFLVENAVAHGMAVGGTVWSLVGMKLVSGSWLLYAASRTRHQDRKSGFLILGLILSVSILVIYLARSNIIFFFALTCFELTFNTLAAKLQASVARTNPQFVGQRLTAAILFGAACGPPLNGLAISSGLGVYFLLFAIISALLPVVWARRHTS